jgi:hypothetical protein
MRHALWAGLLLAGLSSIAHAQTRVQFVHLAPVGVTAESTQVSVRINGAAIANELRYTQTTPYTTLAAGAASYQIEVFQPNQATALITQSLTLAANTDYSVLIIGDVARRPAELQLLTDTTPAPAEGRAKVRFVHAAPFTPSNAGSLVNLLKDDGDPVATGVGALTYKQVTEYLDVPAGNLNVKVMNTDSSRNIVDLAPQILASLSRTTIVISGNNVGQPFGFVSTTAGRLTTETPVDHTATAQWFSLSAASQGFALHTVPSQDRLLGGWFTHDTNGTGPVWFGVDSCNQNTTLGSPCATPGIFNPSTTTTLSIYRTSGARFSQATPVATTEKIGSATIVFTGCNSATFTYILNPPFGSGTLSLLRVGSAIECNLL